MAVAYNERRLTKDVDAIFEPKATIYQTARRMAAELGLNPDWLNDAAKLYLPGQDDRPVVVLERPGVVVRVASPPYLFALKALASRVSRDEDDLRVLWARCGFQTVDQALDLVAGYFPSSRLLPKVEFLLREMFEPSVRDSTHALTRPGAAGADKPL